MREEYPVFEAERVGKVVVDEATSPDGDIVVWAEKNGKYVTVALIQRESPKGSRWPRYEHIYFDNTQIPKFIEILKKLDSSGEVKT